MRKKSYIFFILILASLVHVKAWNDLFIWDPLTWEKYPSKISQADITLHPKGAFMEVGLYLTFSTFEVELDSSTQLEVVYNFDLPANAIVTDSWLWIEGVPEKALILDRWTASAIYESIVQRRQDPSILTKNSATSYELRVYPMLGNNPRKVKINYLVPANWSTGQVTVPVPLSQLKVGWEHTTEVNIYTLENDTWENPVIQGDTTVENGFKPYDGEEYPLNRKASVKPYNNTSCILSFKSPMKEGLFINQYPEGDGGYYQLALLPSALLETDKPKKICFLIDYKQSNEDISNILESTIRNQMESTDSFNIMLSGTEIKKVSGEWIPAVDSIVEVLFDTLGDLVSHYSVLPVLIAEGMKFTGEDGALVIVSDNYQINSNDEANELIEDLADYQPWPVIHVLDLNGYRYDIWMGGRWYYGNEYLYGRLCRMTHGNYVSIRNGKSISQNLEELVQSASGYIQSFDLYTTIDKGFCFSRYDAGLTGTTAYLNRPILQVGRYNGEFPFSIILSGIFEKQSFSKEITIQEEDIFLADSVNRQIWSGMYIRSLEQMSSTNEIIGEIINESLDNRILTYYTAFLTLEPGMEPEINEEEPWEIMEPDMDIIIIGIDENVKEVEELALRSYPNPFTSEITFELEFSQGKYDETACLHVYNLSGQLVRIIGLAGYAEDEIITIRWDGKDESGSEIEPGIYIVRYISGNTTSNIRIVKLR